MGLPVVSVIIPNYNHSKYLKKRIDSVLEQTYKDFELIILDDFSTDNSKDIINLYKDNSHVSHIVYNDVNSGSTFKQWQKGFSLVRGKYIWIAESDDYADPLFLEKLVPILDNNSECNLVYTGSHIIDENDKELHQDWDRNRDKESTIRQFEGESFVRSKMLLTDSIYNASMVLFRTTAINLVDDKYLSYRCSGDWYFFYKTCLHGLVTRVADKLNYFRLHTQNISSTAELKGIKHKEWMFVLDSLIKDLSLKPIQRKVVVGRLFV